MESIILTGPDRTDLDALGAAELRTLAAAMRDAFATVMSRPDVSWSPGVTGDIGHMAERIGQAMDTARAATPAHLTEKYINVGCGMEAAIYIVGLCEGVVEAIAESGEVPWANVQDLVDKVREKSEREYCVTVPVTATVYVTAVNVDMALEAASDRLCYDGWAAVSDWDAASTFEFEADEV